MNRTCTLFHLNTKYKLHNATGGIDMPKSIPAQFNLNILHGDCVSGLQVWIMLAWGKRFSREFRSLYIRWFCLGPVIMQFKTYCFELVPNDATLVRPQVGEEFSTSACD